MWCVQLCERHDEKWVGIGVPVAWNLDEQAAHTKARDLNRAYRPVFDALEDVGEVERGYRAKDQSKLVAPAAG